MSALILPRPRQLFLPERWLPLQMASLRKRAGHLLKTSTGHLTRSCSACCPAPVSIDITSTSYPSDKCCDWITGTYVLTDDGDCLYSALVDFVPEEGEENPFCNDYYCDSVDLGGGVSAFYFPFQLGVSIDANDGYDVTVTLNYGIYDNQPGFCRIVGTALRGYRWISEDCDPENLVLNSSPSFAPICSIPTIDLSFA